MLEVRGLSKHFGGIRAVDACSFTVERGSITALIGPNGAGKTTAFNCISRIMAPSAGEVWLDGERIDRLRPHQVTRRGLSRTFQITRNLEEMTVLENLVVQSRTRHWRELLGPAITPSEREKATRILEFLGITRLAFEETRSLSYGQKKLMDFGALLMSDPKIILLDEPAGGVNPRLLEEIMAHIRALNEQGLTVFIVEHNMNLVMRLSHKVVVMAHGQIIAEGAPKDVRTDPAVLAAYLGAGPSSPPIRSGGIDAGIDHGGIGHG
jgi:branched-chain amino acid transport system ATP-binding protein